MRPPIVIARLKSDPRQSRGWTKLWQTSLMNQVIIFDIKNFTIYSGSPRPCPVSLSANTRLRAREDDPGSDFIYYRFSL